MKILPVILCFILSLSNIHGQTSANVQNLGITNSAHAPRLQLTTSIAARRYSREAGVKLLHLTLSLTYTNTGDRSILLDKRSSLIYGSMVSGSLKEALARKYESDTSYSFISVRSMQAAGMRMDSSPAREAFITLKPRELHSLKKELALRLYDGSKDTYEFLHPGTHFLQLKVATWYYFANPGIYSEKWRDEGYLWSENVTSIPMHLVIEPDK